MKSSKEKLSAYLMQELKDQDPCVGRITGPFISSCQLKFFLIKRSKEFKVRHVCKDNLTLGAARKQTELDLFLGTYIGRRN